MWWAFLGADVPRGVRAAALANGLNYSQMMAPLMQGARGIGAIVLIRPALGCFTEKEQALLKTFADQAVIAIQNARLFNETKEALEQQKASADILSVISRSVADAQPAFDKILRSDEHLFAAETRVILLLGDDDMLHAAAIEGPTPSARAARFRCRWRARPASLRFASAAW